MAKKKLHDTLMLEIPQLRRIHELQTQIRFFAETFSSGACLVLEGLPAINS